MKKIVFNVVIDDIGYRLGVPSGINITCTEVLGLEYKLGAGAGRSITIEIDKSYGKHQTNQFLSKIRLMYPIHQVIDIFTRVILIMQLERLKKTKQIFPLHRLSSKD